MKIELLDIGHCLHPECMAVSGAGLKAAKFPALVALITHPEYGHILFDTGYSEHFIHATQPFPQRLYRWVTPMTLPSNQQLSMVLALRGLKLSDINYVFVSHFHADHVAGLRDLSQARIICSELGYHHCMEGAVHKGNLPSLLPPDLSARAEFLERRTPTSLPEDLTPFSAGIDLFDDGSLYAVSLPGHAVGQYGLLLPTLASPCFLLGDACWSIRNLEGAAPSRLTHLLLASKDSYQQTLTKLTELRNRNTALTLIPSHCPLSHEQYRQLSGEYNGDENV